MMSDELEGMPERQAHVIYKASGTIKEGYSLPMPEIGDTKSFKLVFEVSTITERETKEGDREFIVMYKVAE